MPKTSAATTSRRCLSRTSSPRRHLQAARCSRYRGDNWNAFCSLTMRALSAQWLSASSSADSSEGAARGSANISSAACAGQEPAGNRTSRPAAVPNHLVMTGLSDVSYPDAGDNSGAAGRYCIQRADGRQATMKIWQSLLSQPWALLRLGHADYNSASDRGRRALNRNGCLSFGWQRKTALVCAPICGIGRLSLRRVQKRAGILWRAGWAVVASGKDVGEE
jgi:hypothetical protein